MKIVHSTELMKNQKQAEIMSPESKFLALQTNEGHSLFFSLGTDHVFYLTKELNDAVTGWDKADLSSKLKERHDNKNIRAKAFDVSQNPINGNIDIALGISVEEAEGFYVDYLYLSQNNSNSDTAWSNNINWQPMPFDDPDHKVPVLVISDIYINQTSDGEYIITDILKDPGSSLNFIYRYAVKPSSPAGSQWVPSDLAANLNADKIQSCLGRKSKQQIEGIYTFGTINDKQELVYQPIYNPFNPKIPPNATPLNLPPRATAIAAAPVTGLDQDKKLTNLFVATDGGLYYYAADHQSIDDEPVQVVSNPLFQGVRTLYANASSSGVVVWGLNDNGVIFNVACAAGQETNVSAWSCPVPILTGIEQMTFFLNTLRQNNVLFALRNDGQLLQLTQDPVTTTWQQRNILLPATDIDDMFEVDTFSTHIQITDDNNINASEAPVLISATSPVTVYVNNVYYHLNPDTPREITTDVTGDIYIVQETQGLGAICYHLVLSDGTVADINPMSKMLDTMAGIKTGKDLSNVMVTNADGTQQPLVPSDVPMDQLDVTAQSMQKLVSISDTLPQNGGNMPGTTNGSADGAIWGVSFSQEGWRYYEGAAALEYIGKHAIPLESAIKVFAGNMFNWLKKAYNDVTHFFAQEAGNAWQFFVKIADQVYTFVLNSINTVINTIEFIFNKIKVFLEDLIKWLGFLFQWKDILRTHDVFKNIIRQYAPYSLNQLKNTTDALKEMFAALEGEINQWAGLVPDTQQSIGEISSNSSPLPGQDSPQAYWGVYQTKSNVTAAVTDYQPQLGGGSTVEKLLKELLDVINEESGILTGTYEQLKTQIIDQLTTLSLTDIAKRLLAIISDLVLETAENITLHFIDVVVILVDGLFSLLDAPIRIPVISQLYRLITGGSELSMLDLICLCVSIPATIIYKLMNNTAPFPDDAFTAALIHAPDFETIQQLYRDSMAKPDPEGKPSAITILNIIADIIAAVSSVFVTLFTLLKFYKPQNGKYAFLYALSYTFYMAPDYCMAVGPYTKKTWYVGLNDSITGISFLKTCVDICLYKYDEDHKEPGALTTWHYVSPWSECALNAVWFGPVIGSVIYANKSGQLNTEAWVNFAGGVAFNLGGILSPTCFLKPPYNEAGAIASGSCAVAYGLMELVAAFYE